MSTLTAMRKSDIEGAVVLKVVQPAETNVCDQQISFQAGLMAWCSASFEFRLCMISAVRESGIEGAVVLIVVQPGETSAYDQQVSFDAGLTACFSASFEFRCMSTILAVRKSSIDGAVLLLQWLQLGVWERHAVRTIRRSLAEIAQQAHVDSHTGQLQVGR